MTPSRSSGPSTTRVRSRARRSSASRGRSRRGALPDQAELPRRSLVGAIGAPPGAQPDFRRQAPHALLHFANIVRPRVGRSAVEPLVLRDEPGEVDGQELEESIARAGPKAEQVLLGSDGALGAR